MEGVLSVVVVVVSPSTERTQVAAVVLVPLSPGAPRARIPGSDSPRLTSSSSTISSRGSMAAVISLGLLLVMVGRLIASSATYLAN